jgi:hypothetical protein
MELRGEVAGSCRRMLKGKWLHIKRNLESADGITKQHGTRSLASQELKYS